MIITNRVTMKHLHFIYVLAFTAIYNDLVNAQDPYDPNAETPTEYTGRTISLLPEPGKITEEIAFTDLLDMAGKAGNAATIRESLLEVCKFGEPYLEEYDFLLPEGALVDKFKDAIATICDDAEAAPMDTVSDTCNDLVDTITNTNFEDYVIDPSRYEQMIKLPELNIDFGEDEDDEWINEYDDIHGNVTQSASKRRKRNVGAESDYKHGTIQTMFQYFTDTSRYPDVSEVCYFIEGAGDTRHVVEELFWPNLKNAANALAGAAGNYCYVRNDEEWGTPPSVESPFRRFGQMIIDFIRELNDEGRSEVDICSNIVSSINEANWEHSFGHLAETMTSNFFSWVLEDEYFCRRVLSILENADEDVFQFNTITGYGSAIELCAHVYNTTHSSGVIEDISIPVEIGWGDDSFDLKSFISVFGAAYGMQNFKDGLSIVCQYANDGLSSVITALDFNQLCSALASGNKDFENYLRRCQDEEQYWIDYWEKHERFQEFKEHQTYFVNEMLMSGVRMLLAKLDSDSEFYDPRNINPFQVCQMVNDNLYTSMDDVTDRFLAPGVRNAFRWVSENVRYRCNERQWRENWLTSEFVDDPNLHFDRTLMQILMFMGNHETIPETMDDLCSALDFHDPWREWRAEESSSSSRGGDFRQHIDSVVNTFFDMFNDKDVCTSVFQLLEQDNTIVFYNVTGYAAADLCDILVQAHLGTFDWNRLHVLLLDSFTELDWNAPPDLPGWVTPFADFGSLFAVAVNAWSQPKVIDGLGVFCEHLGTPVGALLGFESEFVQLCNAYINKDFSTWTGDSLSACEKVIVPIVNGRDYPVSLRPFPEEKLFEKIQGYIGIQFDDSTTPEDICQFGADFLNEDISVYDYFYNIIEEVFLFVADEYLVALCRDIDNVLNLVNDNDEFPFDIINELIGFVTGFGSISGVCNEMVVAYDANALQDYLQTMTNSMTSIFSDVTRCESFFDFSNIWFEEVMVQEIFTEIIALAGFDDSSDMCQTVVFYLTQEQEVGEPECDGVLDCAGECNGDATEDCAGICNGGSITDCAGDCKGNTVEDCAGICNGGSKTDCAGDCNGNAVEDCAGICNGGSETDCNGVCKGEAFINDCNECVGGDTRRADNFGADKCGNCRSDPNYEEQWDCHGTCLGTAIVDQCGECVGGDTGMSLTANDGRLDCRGRCDGEWIQDTCDYCEPAPLSDVSYPFGSKYKDCTQSCIPPGSGLPRAYENDCGECVNDADTGLNVCGQCESDPDADATSCEGCDGVANSGKEYDACGVCGGDGTNCVGVSRVQPNLIPDKLIELGIIGAGFSADASLKCLYTKKSDDSQFEGELIQRHTTQYIVCSANLAAGDYDVAVQRGSDLVTDIVASLKVYANIQINSFTPDTLTINKALAGTTFNTVATASDNTAFAAIRALDPDVWDVKPTLLADTQSGETWQLSGEFLSDNEIQFNMRYPANSGQLTARPTINGVSSLNRQVDPYLLTAYYQAPQVEYAKFTQDGAGLIVSFDIGVDYEGFASCDDVFSNAEVLGDGAQCQWRGPRKLYIPIGQGNNLIQIGDTLVIKEGAITAFHQDLSLAASGSITIEEPDESLLPEAVITGSPRLPSCGYVKLDARKSRGGGGRPLTFEWSVSSSGDTTSVSEALDALNGLNDGKGSALVDIDGANLDAGTSYTFTLAISNFLGGSDTASFGVQRFEVAAPEVKILPQGIDPDNVKVSDRFALTAEVTFYSACVPAGETVFEWSCDNARVPMNLKTQNSRKLFVKENSLPSGEDIQFTVKVYKSSDETAYVEQSIDITTIKSELVAKIKGAREFTVGRGSDDVVLDGSLTYDPDEEARSWVYSWGCTQITDNSAAWSFDPDHLGELITNVNNNDGDVLTVKPLAFEADKCYEFTLTATKQERSATASVIICAVNGDPPKIEIQALQDGGKVKDTDVIFLRAKISGAEADTITWTTVGTEDGYGFIDLTDTSNLLPGFPRVLKATARAGHMIAMIGVKKGIAERGTTYAFQISVTNVEGQSATATAYISLRSGPTSCDFSIGDYEAFSEVDVLVENCVTDADAQPLTYQLFTLDADSVIQSVSDAVSEPQFSFVGIASELEDNTRIYRMKVCNTFQVCTQYDATVVVTAKTSLTETETDEYMQKHVLELAYKGDYLKAFANLGHLANIQNGGSSRRRRDTSSECGEAAEVDSDITAEQLELIELTLTETVLTTSSAQLLIDNTASLSLCSMTLASQIDLLDYYLEMIAVYKDAGETMPQSSLDLILEKVSEICSGLDPASNANDLDKCKTVHEMLLGSLTSDLILGGGVVQVVNNDVTLGIQKTLLDGELNSKTGANSVVIDFGSQVDGMFGAAWSCSSGDACSGVTLKISHYNTDVDTYSKTTDDKNNRAADIIDIKLADPDSDDQIDITGLTTPVELTFPLTAGLTNVEYSCVYWDTTNEAWSTSSVTTTDSGDGNVICATTHLTVFTVLGTPIPTIIPTTTGVPNAGNGGLLSVNGYLLWVIIAIAILIIVVVIVVLLVCIVCKMGNRKRVSPSPEPGGTPHAIHAEKGEVTHPHQPAVQQGYGQPGSSQTGYGQSGYDQQGGQQKPMPSAPGYDSQPPGVVPEHHFSIRQLSSKVNL
ncbi:uncharacterized protein [Amphiura filiformis]|uniref:uncharacterized protein n=1 Tax=Amphiura filiformis TaxID=82378 RepID=UPI003B21F0F2